MNQLRHLIRAWLGWHRTVVRSSYLRLPEWLGLSAFVLGLGGLLITYQVLVTPLSSRISALSRETSELRRQTEATRVQRQQVEREAAAFAEAMENWRRFERERLRDLRRGQLDLIDEINALARKHDIKLTDTITFDLSKPNEAVEPASSGGRSQDNRRYPAFDVKFGVTGPYRNIRRFVQALEQSRQFLILHLLSLAPGGTDAASAPTKPATGTMGTGSEELTVTLALTAYFRNDSEADDHATLHVAQRVGAQ
ncbi:MAG: hypothetical protein NZ585_07180 [Chloracidobacterium sp.]|nr:hypothetical protein [Chloracidobacterium sp.]MDW8218473.1 hypothetical protein [Acidobacteriota bacterium]